MYSGGNSWRDYSFQTSVDEHRDEPWQPIRSTPTFMKNAKSLMVIAFVFTVVSIGIFSSVGSAHQSKLLENAITTPVENSMTTPVENAITSPSLPASVLYVVDPDPTRPPTSAIGNQGDKAEYEWCYGCKHRCKNVILSIESHLKTINKDIAEYKKGAIKADVFSFFRGTDFLYLEDILESQKLASPGMGWEFSKHNEAHIWVNADQHMSNFGSFHDALGRLVYDINDFDEVMIGSYAIDLWRASVSVLLQARINGFTISEGKELVRSFAYAYFNTVISYVGNDNELYFDLTMANTYGPVKAQLEQVLKTNTRVLMLDKFAPLNSTGMRAFTESDRNIPVSDKTFKQFHRAWPEYIVSSTLFHRKAFGNSTALEQINTKRATDIGYFNIKDISERLNSGLGSLGSRRYYVLIEGPTTGQDDDVILDVKYEAEPSWFDYCSPEAIKLNNFSDNGERIVMGIKALSMHSSPSIGYAKFDDGSYLVRPRSPWKGAVDAATLTDLEEFRQVCTQMGVLSATAHSRADNDYNSKIIPWSFEAEFAKVAAMHEKEFVASISEPAENWLSHLDSDYACWAAYYNP